MKILFILPAYHPALDFGGPVPVARDIARRLTARGHEVTVWTTNLFTRNEKLGEKTEEREVDGIRVVYLNSVARYRWVGISPDIYAYLRRELDGYDVVHIYGYREFVTLAVARRARKIGKPYVLQALGTTARMSRSFGKKLVYDTVLGRSILRNAAMLIAKSPVEEQQYLEAGIPPERIVLVPNGMELPETLSVLKPGGFRRAHGFEDAVPLVLFLGRIHPVKGVKLLVEAFARLDSPAQLAVVGPDEGYRAELEQLVARRGIGDRVSFVGPLYEEQKWEAYLDADVYVLPSMFENFPRTVLEAMGCGTPVVITDRCGIAQRVEGRAGLVVPYDEEELAGAIGNLLEDSALRERFATGGRRLLEEEFSWEPIVEQLEGVYGRAAEKSTK